MRPRTSPMGFGLYVHVPWCVKKCPYCDFNSHALREDIPESAYVDALLLDLAGETSVRAFDPVESVFIGGGTPSLLSGKAVARLIEGIDRRLPLAQDCEITLEANPGSAEIGRFEDFRRAGVNRLSIGVQSFDETLLPRIGRIHDGRQARLAVEHALAAGFDTVNLDLMYGLPGQTPGQGMADVETAIGFDVPHISHYQLTIEPNTRFYRQPPELPGDDIASDIFEGAVERLAAAGYRRYEVSAYSRPGHGCRHNVNYWRFGDYLGIGAGAHGKLTPENGGVPSRSVKQRHPRRYLAAAATGEFDLIRARCARDRLPLEFMMNGLRLIDGVALERFTLTTSLPVGVIQAPLDIAQARGLLCAGDTHIQPTAMGFQFLNELLLLFAPEGAPGTRPRGAEIPAPAYEAARRAVTSTDYAPKQS